ncbi:ABC transporter permease [Streptomyces vilmorinianum]|uniref:ABC transporter permease n=1 Tax=Streptomyces vilmorinianum TaxID=3051092 RepID=UPI0010FBA0F2|nr:ABC transporter permease [Streptomyces vilmorinianum]
MSQPQFQSPHHNPYNQQPGLPYAPHPAYPAPFGQQPRRGHPVGAFFLGFLASVVVSVIYTGITVATYKEQSADTAQTLYVLHGLLNGAAVGAVIGLVGRRSAGAQISGAVIAPLGVFFGYTNAVPLIIADGQGVPAIGDMMEVDPFIPAKAWWGSQSDTEWLSLLGLAVAAGAAWGLAFVIGKRR